MDKEVLYLLGLLLNTPTKYEDNFLYTKITLDKINCFEAVVKNIKVSPKYLKVSMYAKNVDKNIEAIIFHPRKYHFEIFAINSTLYLKAEVKYKYGAFNIVNPKIITQINKIVPTYSKSKTVPISKDELGKLKLDKKKLELMYQIHHPDAKLANFFNENKTFPDEYIKALKYFEAYLYLYKLSFKKSEFEATKSLDGSYEKFVKNLPFTLTNDQLTAIKDIQDDFVSGIAAKRIIIGDVGCGKTMVIFASVMMALPSRSVLMVPTTVLAKQIYNEAIKHLGKFAKIALVTNENKKSDLSEFDFIVGTHALLYRDIPESHLIMIDEQHRFGTNQRKQIKNLFNVGKKRIHSLQFSATPIPRSLALMNSDLIDHTFIEELPFPKDIDTLLIGKKDFKDLLTHIKQEIEQKHQIIIIYPLVEDSEMIDYQSIESAKDYWLKSFDKVYVTHGKDKDKEKVLEEFSDSGNILIATTLVEVGISLPNLSIIVIVGAERLGLASLHQLRGRVSRNGLKGYCYLYSNDEKNKRLKEFSKTSNGFEIATMDLKYRNSGDIMSGYTQSGASFKWIDLSSDMDIIQEVKKAL